MSVERKLAAVMFTDIVGFTKIMTNSEDTAISILKAQDDIFNPLLEKFSGNLLKKMGDGLLVEFSSAVNAVECALNIQSAIKEYNQTDGDEFHIRIGIHLGDVLMLGDDILGDGVNIASRIEPLAAPDGICITEAVQQSIKSKLKVDARRISEVDLKHIDDKYTIYKVPNVEDEESLDLKDQDGPNRKIKIKNISYSNFFKDCIKYSRTSFLTFLFGSMFGYVTMDVLYNKGLDFNSLLKVFQHFDILLIFLLVFLVSTAINPAILRRVRINFEDIRDIEDILEVLITSMNYRFVSKQNNKLEYTHATFESNWITKLKLSISSVRKMEGLYITFDGNVLTVEGPFMHLKKLIKNFKLYTKRI